MNSGSFESKINSLIIELDNKNVIFNDKLEVVNNNIFTRIAELVKYIFSPREWGSSPFNHLKAPNIIKKLCDLYNQSELKTKEKVKSSMMIFINKFDKTTNKQHHDEIHDILTNKNILTNHDSIAHLTIDDDQSQESCIQYIKEVLKIAKNDTNKKAIGRYTSDHIGFANAPVYDYTKDQNINLIKTIASRHTCNYIDFEKSKSMRKNDVCNSYDDTNYWMNHANDPYYFKPSSNPFGYVCPQICIKETPCRFGKSLENHFDDDSLEIYVISLPNGSPVLCTYESNGTWDICVLKKEPQESFQSSWRVEENNDGTCTNHAIRQVYELELAWSRFGISLD